MCIQLNCQKLFDKISVDGGLVDRFGDLVITGGKTKCDLLLQVAEFWGYSKTTFVNPLQKSDNNYLLLWNEYAENMA